MSTIDKIRAGKKIKVKCVKQILLAKFILNVMCIITSKNIPDDRYECFL